MRNRLKDFDALGAQVLVVDPHESYRVRHVLKEAGFEPEDVHVPILADPSVSVSSTYGAAFQMRIHTEWSNRPSAFVIDRDGTIRSAHRAKSFNDRPTPDTLLEEVARFGKD